MRAVDIWVKKVSGGMAEMKASFKENLKIWRRYGRHDGIDNSLYYDEYGFIHVRSSGIKKIFPDFYRYPGLYICDYCGAGIRFWNESRPKFCQCLTLASLDFILDLYIHAPRGHVVRRGILFDCEDEKELTSVDICEFVNGFLIPVNKDLLFGSK
jgi:hypothetical protein